LSVDIKLRITNQQKRKLHEKTKDIKKVTTRYEIQQKIQELQQYAESQDTKTWLGAPDLKELHDNISKLQNLEGTIDMPDVFEEIAEISALAQNSKEMSYVDHNRVLFRIREVKNHLKGRVDLDSILVLELNSTLAQIENQVHLISVSVEKEDVWQEMPSSLFEKTTDKQKKADAFKEIGDIGESVRKIEDMVNAGCTAKAQLTLKSSELWELKQRLEKFNWHEWYEIWAKRIVTLEKKLEGLRNPANDLLFEGDDDFFDDIGDFDEDMLDEEGDDDMINDEGEEDLSDDAME